MTSSIGVCFEGGLPPQDLAPIVAAADAAQVSTLWVASHLFQREPISVSAIALATTRALGVSLMAMSPYTVHPIYATMAAATLDELFPGRVRLCFGVGAPRTSKQRVLRPSSHCGP